MSLDDNEDPGPRFEAADLKRATYYLRREQILALKLRATFEERNLSDVVREAIDVFLGRGV